MKLTMWQVFFRSRLMSCMNIRDIVDAGRLFKPGTNPNPSLTCFFSQRFGGSSASSYVEPRSSEVQPRAGVVLLSSRWVLV